MYLILNGCPTGPSLNDPEKLSDLKLGKQYENVDLYKRWVCDRRDNGPRPKPNRPCGGTELPVVFWRQPKVKLGAGSVAKVIVSCESFAAMDEPP